MSSQTELLLRKIACLALLLISCCGYSSAATWNRTGRDKRGKPIGGAAVHLTPVEGSAEFSTSCSANGEFQFGDLKPGNYKVEVIVNGKTWTAAKLVALTEGQSAAVVLELSEQQDHAL